MIFHFDAMRMYWTKKEDAVLYKLYADTQSKEIAKLLGRSVSQVYNRAVLLGLKKSEAFKKSEKSGCIQKGKRISESTEFKHGHKTWNKGLKLPTFSEKQRSTQFKKGALPHNTKSDNSITIRRDKSGRLYKWIRITNGNWEMLHVNIWKQANGPIPKDMVVVFKDKNSMNVVIENLELISRKENMLRNQIHNYPEEIKSTIRALTKLKRTINGSKKNNG